MHRSYSCLVYTDKLQAVLCTTARSRLLHCIVICIVYITSLMTWTGGPDQSARWLYYPNCIIPTESHRLYCSPHWSCIIVKNMSITLNYSKVQLYRSAVELYHSGVLAV